MTSSLVGSEMCIRDRTRALKLYVPSKTLPQATTDHHHRSEDHQHRQEPVSYTHLTLPTICSV
eukprot:11060788-Prorocentrum_lima.AAC.1